MVSTFKLLFQWVAADPSISFYVLSAAFLLMIVIWIIKYGLESGYSGWIPFLIAIWASTWAGIFLFSLETLVHYEDFILFQTDSPVIVLVLDIAILGAFILLDAFWFVASRIFTRGGGVITIGVIVFSAVPYSLGLALGAGGIWGGIALAAGTVTVLSMLAFPRLRPLWRNSSQQAPVDQSANNPALNRDRNEESVDHYNPLRSFEIAARKNPALAETVIIKDCTRLQAEWVTPRLGGRIVTLLGHGQARAAFAVSYFLWNHYFRRLPGFESIPETTDLPTLCGRALAQVYSDASCRPQDEACPLLEGLVRISRATTLYFANVFGDSRATTRQVRQVHADLGAIHSAAVAWHEQGLRTSAS